MYNRDIQYGNCPTSRTKFLLKTIVNQLGF